MQSTHMQAHTDSNKANNETSTDQHADRCMQTLTECTAAVRHRTATADHPELQRSTCDQLDARTVPVASHDRPRIDISFIGLIPRRWITIAATQWQFLATVEPVLLPLSGEVFSARSTITSASARADVRANGFWGEDAYFDVKVFHPYASSYQSRTPTSLFQTHETRKRLEYEERIVNVDHRGSFTPLVFSSTGSAGPMADTFLQRLAGKLSEKDGVSYSSSTAWLRCRFSAFALLRGSILCILGSRSRKRCPTHHSER